MDITPLIRSDQQVIVSYAGGVFKVSGISYEHAIIVTPDKTHIWDIGNITDVSELEIAHFSYLIENSNEIDVILLGCGKNMVFMPQELKLNLKNAGLSIDIMPTGAACRTYNVLMAEGRRVACALLLE